MRSLNCRRAFLRPAKPWFAKDRNSRCAFDGLDDSDQLSRPEGPLILKESRREICDLKRSRRSLERRLENVGVREIALSACFTARGTDAKTSSIVESRSVEQIGSESNLGRQHQTTSPLLSINAEN